MPGCAIYEFIQPDDALIPRTSFGHVVLEPENVPIPLSERSGDRWALERREIILERVADESVPQTVRTAMLAVGELTHLHVPLVFGGQGLGTLVLVETSGEREFSSYELELARGLGEHAAAALHAGRAYQAMQLEALTDGLTGLFNYRHLRNRLKEETARYRRYRTPLSLLMLDVDDFKQFNDQYGHQAGDEALIVIAEVLRETLRTDVDVVCRYGGEEFAVLLPNTALVAQEEVRAVAPGSQKSVRGGLENLRTEAAPAIAERLRAAVEERGRGGVTPLRPQAVTISIGVSCTTADTRTPDELVAAADKALYLAKRLGKNRVETYHPSDAHTEEARPA